MEDNYLIPISRATLPGDLAVFIVASVLAMALIVLMSALAKNGHAPAIGTVESCLKGRTVAFFALTAALMLMWLLWLLGNYPGIVYSDTYNSFEQALHIIRLDNRNPILFSLLIRLCLFIGGAYKTGDITAGCAIFSLFQMLFMSACLSYMICWLCCRFGLRRFWYAVFGALYGLSPYVGVLSISMLKDPLFSSCVVLWSLQLADAALSDGRVAESRGWLLRFCLVSLLILFLRNNGVCAFAVVVPLLLAAAIRGKKAGTERKGHTRLLCLSLAALLVWAVVNGPVYKKLGMGTPREETGGMLLNQMARVAAYEGNMSDSDREYMQSIMPLERYKSEYRPCCVDLLKWGEGFNYDPLYSLRFYKTYASMLVKNPVLFAEGWALESYGFWTVNRPEVNGAVMELYSARDMDVASASRVGEYTLRLKSFLTDSELGRQICGKLWSPPLGILNWLMLLAVLQLNMRGDGKLSLALAPSLGIMAGLVVGTPIHYLPRYGLPIQLLLPLIILFLFAKTEKT